MSQEFYSKDKDNVIDIDMKKMQRNIFRIAPIIILVLILLFAALNSFYLLEDKENGVVLRFGKVHQVVKQPGLNFKVPFIDLVRKVDVSSIYVMEYGYRTAVEGSTRQEAVYQDVPVEATVIVDGANNNASIGLLELIIQYKVSNPEDYLFKVDDVEDTLRLALEDAIRASVQALSLDEAKTQKERIDEMVKPQLQQKMNDYQAGLEIILVATQERSVSGQC